MRVMRAGPGPASSFSFRFVAAAAAVVLLLAVGSARAERPRIYAITGARIVTAPGQTIENGTLVMRDGLIEAVGAGVSAPAEAVVIDGKGKTVHAGFIDACSSVGLRVTEGAPSGGSGGASAAAPAAPRTAAPREALPPPGAGHPIARFHPERRALDLLGPSDRDLEKHRAMGFTAALTLPPDGIFRGTSALLTLGETPVSRSVVKAEVAQHVAFERGGFGRGYPGSLMGAIAAIRQGFEDARRHEVWQARYDADPRGLARPDMLTAYGPLALAISRKIPVVFDAEDPSNVLRALAIAKEFSLDAMVIGSGADYEVLDEIKASARPVIVTMAFPEKPDLDDADEALDTETLALRRYAGAPADAGRLAAAGIPIAIGTCRMKNTSDFAANLRKAIDAGLSKDAALAALTTGPARLFGVERSLGTLEPGKAADLVMLDGDLFAEKTKAVRVFVDGIEYPVEEKKPKGDPNAKVDPRGTWSVSMTIGGRVVNRTWQISGREGAYEGTGETREGTVAFTSVKLAGNELTVVLPARGGGSQEITVIITGDAFEGSGEFGSGQSFDVKGTRTSGPQGGGEEAEEDGPYSCTEEMEGGGL